MVKIKSVSLKKVCKDCEFLQRTEKRIEGKISTKFIYGVWNYCKKHNEYVTFPRSTGCEVEDLFNV